MKNRILVLTLISILISLSLVSSYSVNFGDSNQDYSRHNFIYRDDVSDTDRAWSTSYVGYNIRLNSAHTYYYATFLASDGSYIFRDETPNPLAFQNVTNRDGSSVTGLTFRDGGRTILWEKSSGDGLNYNVFSKNYVPRSSTDDTNVAPAHDHSHPSGLNVCLFTGGNYRISWNPSSKSVQNVSFAKIPSGRTFRNTYLRDASTSSAVANFNLTNRSFEFNTGSFRGDVLFMQFTYSDNSKSDVSNKTITSVTNCEPMVIPPSNQTIINNNSNTGNAIVYVFLLFVITFVTFTSYYVMWKTKFSNERKIKGSGLAQSVVISKSKYLKLFLMCVNYFLTIGVLTMIKHSFTTYVSFPEFATNVDFILSILWAVIYPFLVSVFAVIIAMLWKDNEVVKSFERLGTLGGR